MQKNIFKRFLRRVEREEMNMDRKKIRRNLELHLYMKDVPSSVSEEERVQ